VNTLQGLVEAAVLYQDWCFRDFVYFPYDAKDRVSEVIAGTHIFSGTFFSHHSVLNSL
jgi:hypothetical protein